MGCVQHRCLGNHRFLRSQFAGIRGRACGSAGPPGRFHGRLKIDRFERCAVSENGKAGGQTVHYAIYSEGLPVSDVEFLGDELKRETRRPVHEGAILYDADGRTLDVVASGGKAVRDRIADSFAQNMLGIKGKIHPVTVRHFALNRLRRPMAFDSDDCRWHQDGEGDASASRAHGKSL
jgi:hypothetical protein